MPSPYALFTSAPDKTSHNTIGWTPKTLFSFHYTEGLDVPADEEVFNTIVGSVYNYKGSNILPTNYFRSPNVNSGRSLKITMYFRIVQNGQGINIFTGLYDITNGSEYSIDSYTIGGVSDNGGQSYCKYESYMSTLQNAGDGKCYLQATGNIIFPINSNGETRMTTINNVYQITNYASENISYRPILINRCNGYSMYVTSLMLEEIG